VWGGDIYIYIYIYIERERERERETYRFNQFIFIVNNIVVYDSIE
jgi:hypothetical protein